jgi:hypothetical protein
MIKDWDLKQAKEKKLLNGVCFGCNKIMNPFKDKTTTRKCIGCNGKGYTQDYEEFQGVHEVSVRTLELPNKCFKCNTTGIETIITRHAWFKEFKFTPWPVWKSFGKSLSVTPEGYISVFQWLAYKVVWKLNAHKIFEHFKVPYEKYKVDYEGDLNFEILSFHKAGGDYILGDHYYFNIDLLGIRFRCSWTNEGRWTYCQKCGNAIPDTADWKDLLCTECKYPHERIDIQKTGEEIN